jgi:hypothetical protein
MAEAERPTTAIDDRERLSLDSSQGVRAKPARLPGATHSQFIDRAVQCQLFLHATIVPEGRGGGKRPDSGTITMAQKLPFFRNLTQLA